MKKSKEYAKEILDKYIETDADTAIKTSGLQAIQALCKEYEEISKQRKLIRRDGISYNGMLSLLQELHIKWLSICRKVNKEVKLLDEDGWLNYIEETMPGLYPNLIKKIIK